MKYLNPTFSCPAAPSKVTQEEWDRIFGERERREDGPRMSDIVRVVDKVTKSER